MTEAIMLEVLKQGKIHFTACDCICAALYNAWLNLSLERDMYRTSTSRFTATPATYHPCVWSKVTP